VSASSVWRTRKDRYAHGVRRHSRLVSVRRASLDTSLTSLSPRPVTRPSRVNRKAKGEAQQEPQDTAKRETIKYQNDAQTRKVLLQIVWIVWTLLEMPDIHGLLAMNRTG
jgi:hypothetical protein